MSIGRTGVNHGRVPQNFGEYTGGELWVEVPEITDGNPSKDLVPPPGALTTEERQFRGRVVDTHHTCVHFDAHLQHAVFPGSSGRRVSVALHVLKGWESLEKDVVDKLLTAGFQIPDAEDLFVCAPMSTDDSPAEVHTLPGDDFQNLTYDNAVAQGSGDCP